MQTYKDPLEPLYDWHSERVWLQEQLVLLTAQSRLSVADPGLQRRIELVQNAIERRENPR